MKQDGEFPLIEQSARGLGVRDSDVQLDDEGRVHPGAGMSVAPDDPLNLVVHRRPREYGGTGRDPVWEIADAVLPEALAFDADGATHGVIGPAVATELPAYREYLGSTQQDWSRLA